MPLPPGDTLDRIIAVEEVCLPGMTFTPPPLDWLALFLTLQGTAQLRAGVQVNAHQPGSLIAVSSGSEIVEQVGPHQAWHVRYLLLTGPWADQMDAWLRRNDTAMIAWTPAAARHRQIFSEMIELVLTQRGDWQWPFLSRCADLWGMLYSDTTASSSGDALLLQVAALLDEAPAQRPSLEEMAELLNMTSRQLIYRFHNAAGEPIAQWIRRRRIAAAHRLLCQGWSVTSVAEQLGFANPYHFSRTFKEIMGVSPSKVREDALRGALHSSHEAHT